jgi:cytochrome c peroxidase
MRHVVIGLVGAMIAGLASGVAGARDDRELDHQLAAVLSQHGFTGAIERNLEHRLGRRLDRRLVRLGNLLWFDELTSVDNDNTCGGCHAPPANMGDTQSIAIGIDNNHVVGPDRTGPRNQRRAPTVVNSAVYPNLMWNSRFASRSGNPFDNSAGFSFPAPEGTSLSYEPQLLVAQAFIPPTERVEAAGFVFPGDNDDIRGEVIRRLNDSVAYRRRFGRIDREVERGAPITYEHFARAIAEFEFSLVFTDAPIDRFARGDEDAMTTEQKEGALLFFGKAGCVACHAVAGQSNEMFSDFSQHVIGVPQVAPTGGNVTFDGPGADEDFGLEQITGNPADRYKFRTSPIRNAAVQPAFFHNGAFTTLEDAIRHHLNVYESARSYRPVHLDADLRGPVGPIEPVLERLDPLLQAPIELSDAEFQQLYAFVAEGLLDRRALPEHQRHLVPRSIPSGRSIPTFEFE